MKTEIDGDRITLRRYEKRFAPLLFEAARESAGGEFTRWMPWCHENYSIEDSRSFVKRSVEEWQNETEFNFAVFDAANGDFLGGVGLSQYNKNHKFFNLGYWIRTSRQNRGFASAATRLLARASFEDLPINRIEILAVIENAASHRVAEKAGATREGVLRKRLLIGGTIHNAVMFSLVREDFNL